MGAFEDLLNKDAERVDEPSIAPVAPKGAFEELIARDVPEKSGSGVTAETPWSDVLWQGAKNIPADIPRTAIEVAQGLGAIGSAAMHPIETGKALYNADWSGIGDQLSQDYLTEEGWKKGIAERPISRLMDVSMLAAGPEALAAKTALAMGAPRVAKGINIASKVHDPAAWAIGGTRWGLDKTTRVAHELAGEVGTHTGGYSLDLLRQAGKESPETYKAASAGLKSKADIDDMVKGFEQAVDDVRDEGYARYRADKDVLKTDNQRLSFTAAEDAIKQAEKDFLDPFTTSPNPDVVRVLDQLRNIVGTKSREASLFDIAQTGARRRMGIPTPPGAYRGPNPHLDPLAFDDIKKAVGRITADSTGEAKAVAARVQEALANEIKTNAPLYEKMMGEYSALSDALRAYRRELSIGKDPDTALRKLFSSLRTNVASSFWRRRELVEQLAKNPKARKALYAMAGQYNSAWFPRGLTGQIKMGTVNPAVTAGVGLGFLNPAFLGYLPIQSPRLMGRAALMQGAAERHLSKIPGRPFIYSGHAAASPYAQQALENMEIE